MKKFYGIPILLSICIIYIMGLKVYAGTWEVDHYDCTGLMGDSSRGPVLWRTPWYLNAYYSPDPVFSWQASAGYGSNGTINPVFKPQPWFLSSLGTIKAVLNWYPQGAELPPSKIYYQVRRKSDASVYVTSSLSFADAAADNREINVSDGYQDSTTSISGNFSPLPGMYSSNGYGYEDRKIKLGVSSYTLDNAALAPTVTMPECALSCSINVDTHYTNANTYDGNVEVEYGVYPYVPYINDTLPANPNPIVWNPDAHTVSIYADVFQVYGVIPITLTIYDTTQHPIKTYSGTVSSDNSRFSVNWDGSTDSGGVAPKGIYLFKFSLDGDYDSDKSPYVSISTPGTDAQLVSDDGTNASFTINYALSSSDSPQRSGSLGSVTMYDPNGSVVKGQALTAADLTPGSHTVPLSMPSPQTEGDYKFLINVKDNDANQDFMRRSRWALQHNQKYYNSPSIVYINSGMWHVAWCVAGRNVNRSTLDIAFSDRSLHYVPNLVDNVNTSDVRAGVNGAVFNQSMKNVLRYLPIGGVGTGTPGAWHIGGYSDRQLFCFGMAGTGNNFGQARMEPVTVVTHGGLEPGRHVTKYNVAKSIQNKFGYGFGTVGLIIDNNVPRSHAYMNQWNTGQLGYPPGRPPAVVPRTAVGWTTNGDFLLVSCNGPATATSGAGATWDDVQAFLITTLPQLINQQYHKTIAISNAVMLDGGGSVQFAYRWQNPDGSVVMSDNGAPIGDSERSIPTAIYVYANKNK